MADSFQTALTSLFGTAASPLPTPTPSAGASATPRPSGAASPTPGASPSPAASQTVTQLVKSASDHYDAAQAALKAGDFAEYGRQIGLLQDDLAKLRALTGQ